MIKPLNAEQLEKRQPAFLPAVAGQQQHNLAQVMSQRMLKTSEDVFRRGEQGAMGYFFFSLNQIV